MTVTDTTNTPATPDEQQVNSTDILIVGGGVVGAIMAHVIARHTNYRVVLCEKSSHSQLNQDPRYIAVAHASLDYLAQNGLALDSLTQGIRHIHVSDSNQLGQVRLHANEMGIDELGAVVHLASLNNIVMQSNMLAERIQCLYETGVEQISRCSEGYQCNLLKASKSQRLMAKLVIIADGKNSQLLVQSNLHTITKAYGQHAVVAKVRVDHAGPERYANHDTAFERFTANGPLAMLPIKEQHAYSLVWSQSETAVDTFLNSSQAQQQQLLQHAFGWRLGNVTHISELGKFPLSLSYVAEPNQCPYMIIGNASQSLHPIAGQGFNLALRDIKDAIAWIMQSNLDKADVAHYYQQRKRDKSLTIGATDFLVHVFSNDIAPLITARHFGLLALQKSAFIRKKFTRLAMGYRNI